jgi:hypothetical protein
MATPAAPIRVVATPPAWLVAAALALLWLAVAPRTPDLAAQVYRSTLYAQDGFRVWDDFWYAGHHLPAYSLLFPPLGALVGARVVGVGAAIASAVLFERLARRHFGAERARWGTLWFAAASIADLCIGRLTFSLGIALGLAALLALQSRRPRTAIALALLCGAGSPVAGAFLGLAGAAVALTTLRHRVAAGATAAAALGVVGALTFAFPEGGRQPMSTFAIAALAGGCAALLWVLPAEQRTLRLGTWLYLVAGVGMFVMSTPMGSNVARLGATFGGPLLACAITGSGRLQRPGRAGLVVVAAGLLGWQWWGPAREITISVGDPSTTAAYFAPLKAALRAQGGPDGRLEVPFTRSHWESVHLAGGRDGLPLARGWETQLDRRYNALFFTPRLDAEAYHRWLRRNAVRHVAVPDAPLDPSGRAEAALVRRGLPFLRPVWRNRHWRLYAVTDPRPLVSGPATLTAFGRDGFSLRARRRGWVLVRTHFSPYFASSGAPACLSTAPGGWTRVFPLAPGPIRVEARFDPERLGSTAASCTRAVTPVTSG